MKNNLTPFVHRNLTSVQQGIFPLSNGHMHWETLLRSISDTGECYSAGSFLSSLAPQQMVAIDKWVVNQAVQQVSQFPDDHTLFINLAPSSLQFSSLLETINDLFLYRSKIGFEVTEYADLSDEMLRTLWKIKRMGHLIALDDFGAGSTSMRYLSLGLFDIVKIDRSFINSIGQPHNDELLRGFVQMLKGLGLEVVAEGVETTEQLKFIRTIGCDYAQGYLLHHPDDTETRDFLLAA